MLDFQSLATDKHDCASGMKQTSTRASIVLFFRHLPCIKLACFLILFSSSIRFMRMSSEIFPFSSHGKYGYNLEYADAELKVRSLPTRLLYTTTYQNRHLIFTRQAVGDLAKSLNHRLTLHPGQFTQIGSPSEKVVAASIRELEYHCEMMDRMGLGPDGVMIIHMGVSRCEIPDGREGISSTNVCSH